MFVIDVFETSRLLELSVGEKPFEPEIIAVGFFILDDQTNELRVGEIGRVGMSEFIAEAFGHAEQFECIESRERLFIEHERFSSWIVSSP